MNTHISFTRFELILIFLLFFIPACTPPVTTLTQATNDSNSYQTPVRSPISRPPTHPGIFIFNGQVGKQSGLFLADLYQGQIEMLNNIFDASCPAYSPDGESLAFCLLKDRENNLFVMKSGGDNAHQLTKEVRGCGCSPDAPLSWSPDSHWLAFQVPEGDSNQPIYDIYVVSFDGLQAINVTSSPQRYGGALWNPDSQSILISGKIGDQQDIYDVNISTKKAVPIVNHPLTGAPTSWSPDGKTLLYYADSGDGNFDIYALKRGEAQPTRLTEAAGFDQYPIWFPDGKHILFTSSRDGNHEIYRMNSDGSNQVNLTNNPEALDIWPTISQDGQQIIYLTSYNNQWDSWVMNADGSNRKKMTEILGIPRTVTWSP